MLIIEASLTYGKIWTRKQEKLIYIGIIVFLICPFYSIILCCLPELWSNEKAFLSCMLFFSFFSVLGLFFCIYEINKNRKIRRLVEKWKQDSIQAIAEVNLISKQRKGFQPISDVMIELSFIIKNKKYYRRNLKHHKYFLKYVDKKISILFSPTYNEVMILKQA